VDCFAETDGGEPHVIRCADVELEFNSIIGILFLSKAFPAYFDTIHEALQHFLDSVLSMQRELFLSYLRSPRSGEKILFQRYIICSALT
jgi:hypothetical protein